MAPSSAEYRDLVARLVKEIEDEAARRGLHDHDITDIGTICRIM